FSKPRPAGLGTASTADELFRAFAAVPASETLYRQNLASIEAQLTKTHAFALPTRDLESLRQIFELFFRSGFALRASPTYADLMTATDERGTARSYLSSEPAFAFLKDLETRNLVVPVVGDFGGPKAIRAIARWLKARGATVGAFYLSNVEQYLLQDGKWGAF